MIRAIGTKLILRRAPKITSRGGIAIPGQAQTPSNAGLVLRVGEKVQFIAVGDVVLFSDMMVVDPLCGRDGKVLMEFVDEEAITCAMSLADATDLGIEFTEDEKNIDLVMAKAHIR